MRKNKLNVLKKNIKAYSKEFRTFNINEISDEKFQELLNTHKLDITNLENEYTEKYTKK